MVYDNVEGLVLEIDKKECTSMVRERKRKRI